jgi:MFS family permease
VSKPGRLGPNFWKLWSASVAANLGDGLALIAYPWLASAITRDGFKLGLVALATRLPWLLLSLPAGVLTDRLDRRRVIVTMDVVRAVITFGVAAMVVIAGDAIEAGTGSVDLMYWVLVGAAFIYGSAEVLRDNTAQTILPAIVSRDSLERANGRLWSAEMVMNSFVGPPLAGVLIAIALATPFLAHGGTLVVAAALMLLIAGDFRPNSEPGPRPDFRTQLVEGFKWLWSHQLFRPLAIALGMMNGAMAITAATYVLFVQEVLGLGPSGFGILMTGGAVGGILGSLGASRVVTRLGKGPTLQLTLALGFLTLGVIAVTSSGIVVWTMFLVYTAVAMMWNVVTVSLRQRAIPDSLLGRVNSVYRFFGWGMLSVGALLGGILVSAGEPMVGREWALRLPFVVASALQLLIWIWAGPKLKSDVIAEVEAAVEPA